MTTMHHLAQIAAVGIGGGLGAIGRHALGGWILHRSGAGHFPLGTLIVNIAGCLAIGLVGGLAERHHAFTPAMRIFLIPGLLGGFTTFSAFGFETLYLLRRGDWWMAAVYVMVSVSVGIGAVGLGLSCAGADR